jgi:hypothetical protein
MSAHDLHLQLRRLAAERVDAVEAGLGDNALYMDELEHDLATARAAYVGPRRDRDRLAPRGAVRAPGRLTAWAAGRVRRARRRRDVGGDDVVRRALLALDEEAVVLVVEDRALDVVPAKPRTASRSSQRVSIVKRVRSSSSRRSIHTPRLPGVAAYPPTPVCSR